MILYDFVQQLNRVWTNILDKNLV